ncbi:hypothetical protein [Streptomyces sp. NPDC001380]|uniref:hypothetical protein n=1 Tax=Streptomyces sp. NPDC001380 TaxID=3364566 RepID=UPI00369C0BF2
MGAGARPSRRTACATAHRGSLRTVASGADTPSTLLRLDKGCEDLGFHRASASDRACSEPVNRNLAEYAGNRPVHAIRADGL